MKCPGQDTLYWKPGAIFEAACPQCRGLVEFFKDDTSRACPYCGHRFVNPRMDFGCAAYCPNAQQCMGGLPPEAAAEISGDLLKEKAAVAAKKFFKNNFSAIGRMTQRMRLAEEMAKASKEISI